MADADKSPILDGMAASGGAIRNACRAYNDWLADTPTERMICKHEQADVLFRLLGTTFTA